MRPGLGDPSGPIWPRTDSNVFLKKEKSKEKKTPMPFISIAIWTVEEVIQTPLSQCLYLEQSLYTDVSEMGWSLETFP